MGYIRKALEKGYLKPTRSACCSDDLLEIFVRFGRCLYCLLPPFVNRHLPCPHTSSFHGLLLPPMHQQSLWCREGLALGAWVHVARHQPGSQAKKPRTLCNSCLPMVCELFTWAPLLLIV